MGKQKESLVVLIDGHALIHRAFHAIPELTTKDGQVVNAAYGFSLILLNALNELKPKYGAVSFDLAKPTFRHKEFEDYKAKRKKTPKELSKQIPLIKEIVRTLNIPIYEQQGYEADDIVGSLAKQISQKYDDLEVTIVTGDLDILQLVDDSISVYTMKKGLTNMIKYDPAQVEKRYGFTPEYLVDYKGLKGDPSDNLPGVEGIGDKTAKTLIEKHGHLEKIYEDLENGLIDLSDRLKNNLEKSEEIALQCKNLATIRTDIDLSYSLDKMELCNYNRDRVVKLFSKLEFKSLLDKLPNDLLDGKQKVSQGEREIKQNPDYNYKLVENKNQLENLKRKIEDKKQTVVDIETETLDGKIVGLSFCLEAGSAYYLPVGDKFKLVDIEDVLKSSRIKKIGHGLKYDYRLLLENGIELKNLYFDTMIAAYLLDPERRNYKLDRLVFNELGQEMIPLTDLMGEDHQTKLSQVEVEKIKDYSCEDSDMSYRLYQLYNSRLEEKNLSQLFNQIEMPLVAILAKMESLGIKVSKEKLLKLKDKLEREIEENKKQVKDLVGTDFNLDSPLQLREILFDRLEISSQGVSKTKTGLSTSASELNKIKNRHPVVELILKHRQMEKIRNTYVVPLLERNEERIKTNFNQVVAATGRLSSSDPNLQNIPARSELAQEVRKVFRAQKGFKLVSLDYSQIELRVAAHLSGDRAMIEAFKQGQDIHQATAAKLFDLSLSQVKPEQRDQAKTINFAVLYGMSPYGLAQSLETDRDYAKQFIDNYFKNFSGVKKYLDNIVKEAQEKGYVETLFGRRRYFNLDRSRQLKRAAINTPIQGTAADLMKKAMINIDKKINLANNLKEKDKPRMLLQVHDELIFEIKNNQTAEFSAKVKKIMEEVVRLKVPLKVDLKIGPSWGELEKKDV